jgi:hypothetical protein
MLFSDIVFPVHRIRIHNSIYTNPLGLIIVEGRNKDWILDDTNMSESFPIRRIKLASLGREVYPLRDKYDHFSQVVHKPSNTTFIDSEGTLFTYSKAGKYWNLVYHPIERMQLTESGVSTLIHIRGIPMPFLFHTILSTSIKYMGLLTKHGMYIPYDLSTYNKPNGRRMI